MLLLPSAPSQRHPLTMAEAFLSSLPQDVAVFATPFIKNWKLLAVCTSVWFILHAFAVILWTVIYPSVLRDITQRLIEADVKKGKRKSDKHYNYRAFFDLTVNTVAFFHAIVSSAGAAYAIYKYPFGTGYSSISPYDGTPLYQIISTLSAGYFVHDFVFSLIDLNPPFIVHGLLSFIIYGHATNPFYAYTGAVFLSFEFSTVFLHVRWLLINLGLTKSTAFGIINKLFLFFFVSIRLFLGPLFAFISFQPSVWSLIINILGGNPPTTLTVPYNSEIAPSPAISSMADTFFSLTDTVTPKTVSVPHSLTASLIFAFSNILLQLLNVYWVLSLYASQKRAAAKAKQLQAKSA